MEAPLPQVVEFDHRHTVKVVNDGTTTRIIATPNPKFSGKYKRIHDLPFTGKPSNWDRWCWWFFPKAANWVEARERGEFFWNEFVAFARGPQKRRRDDAVGLLVYVLEGMPGFPDGRQEADVFRRKMIEAVVAHLRVGLDEAKPAQEVGHG